MATPVFIVTGFLESGKTTLVKDTLMEQDWMEDGLTVLIACEEGEEEYEDEYLEAKNMVVVPVEDFSELNTVFFKRIEKEHHPVQIIIEYNGTWKLQDLLNLRFPRSLELAGIYSTVDGSTLDVYMMNMRQMLLEQLSESQLIIVNRCGEGMDRSAFRRALKLQNPMAQVIFESLDGEIIEPTEEDLPFDLKADPIVVDDIDFGVWYVDAYDHPEHYLHKRISFLAQVFRPNGLEKDMFVPVRKIMTCCEADTRFYGYPCHVQKNISLKRHMWAKMVVRFETEFNPEAGEPTPVLYLEDLVPAKKPEIEVVSMG